MSGLGSEIRLELLNDYPRNLRQVLDMPEPVTPLANRYADGHVAVHVHLGIRRKGLNLESEKRCAVFEAAEWQELLGDDLAGASDETDRNSISGILQDGQRCVDDLVFVHVRETTKEGEVGVLRPVRSLIRLNALDDCPMPWGHAIEALRGLRAEVVGVVGDGERVVTPRLAAVEVHKLPDEVVKCGSGVVDDVSDDHAESERRLVFDYGVDDVVAAIRVEVGNREGDWLALVRKEGVNLPLQQIEMFVCPRELGSDAVK